MADLKFVDQHNMVACLEKTEENAEFHQIVDFLSTCSINYALTISPTIYASYIKQFWNTATSKIVNSMKQIHAIVDGKVVVISESSVRSDLLFNDEDGISFLTNDDIFENLALIGYEQLSTKLTFQKGSFSPQWKFLIHTILHCISSKSTAWNEFSTNLASAVICLAKGQKFNFSKLIFDGMLRNLDPKRFLMYPRFLQLFLNNQLKDLPEPFNDTYETPTHSKKVFSNMARKSKKISGKVTPLFDSMLVQNQAPEGEGSAIPPEPQPTPSTSQPNVSEPQTESLQTETPPTVSHELQTEAHIEQILPSPSTYQRKQRKTQKHRRAKKVTELPQTSVPLDHGADEKVKRLEKALRARTPWMKLFKIGTLGGKGLDKENVSKGEEKDKDANELIAARLQEQRREQFSMMTARLLVENHLQQGEKLQDDAEKEELRACLDIVQGDDIAIDVESFANKYPIVDWKTHILTENMMYYQIIRADGSSKNYKIFSEMLDDFDRQDVMDLHRLLKERYDTNKSRRYALLLWTHELTQSLGLDDVYQHIKSNLLTRETLPDVKDVFAIVSREESHRDIASSSSFVSTSQTTNGRRLCQTNYFNNGINGCGFDVHLDELGDENIVVGEGVWLVRKALVEFMVSLAVRKMTMMIEVGRMII
ncbi:hypothetical protein Tco_0175179 [Tanacetum coccineum]